MDRRQAIVAILATLAAAPLLAGCPASPDGGPADVAGRKVRVAATTGMVADLAKNVGGDRVEVTALMGPGTDPHYYKATAGDIKTLTEADIVFYNGLDLEGRMAETLEGLEKNGKRVVAVASALPPTELRQPREFQGRHDPHVWFDVSLWGQTTAPVTEALVALDPTHADVYKQNSEAYRKKLEGLHKDVQTNIAKLPEAQRVLITAHDAFGYFGKRYGVEVRGLQGTSTTTEAGARDVQDLAAFIAERKIKAIFVESSVPPQTIEAVQKAVRSRGWDVQIGGQLFSDAMGAAGTPEGTYEGMVRHNVRTMVEALK